MINQQRMYAYTRADLEPAEANGYIGVSCV
jgi:hypothetical protein